MCDTRCVKFFMCVDASESTCSCHARELNYNQGVIGRFDKYIFLLLDISWVQNISLEYKQGYGMFWSNLYIVGLHNH